MIRRLSNENSLVEITLLHLLLIIHFCLPLLSLHMREHSYRIYQENSRKKDFECRN